jgi:hypothetical protein
MEAAVVTKGDFAKMIGVSPGRVSQMISEGMIGADALVGEGRMAKINASLAADQIRSRRDIGQALGNGISTRLDMPDMPFAQTEQSPRRPTLPVEPATEDLIKLERLAAERRRNRQADEDDAKRRGELADSVQVRIEMAKIANEMLQTFEGALPEMATALAAKFELPQRDVLHELKQRFAEVRSAASERAKRKAVETPALQEVVLADGSNA